MNAPELDHSGTAWISKGFAELVAEQKIQDPAPVFDVLIVGSGYGGAIAVDTLSQLKKKNQDDLNICVLERGKEYLPGSFPANVTEVPGHLRGDRKNFGLFDFRSSNDVNTLIANGLGGGSLINAGVMVPPDDSVFDVSWPDDLRNPEELRPYLQEAAFLLGAVTDTEQNPNTVTTRDSASSETLHKFEAISKLAGSETFQPAPITVANSDKINRGGVKLSACIRCGDCAAGCNFNAKDSLDTNLLFRAHRRGTKIYTGATVLRIERNKEAGNWNVHTVFTDQKLRKLHGSPTILTTEKLILAAGTLGSVEILLRSESNDLDFSNKLGECASTNGDSLITHFNTNGKVNTTGKASEDPWKREVGPTITGIIDTRKSADQATNGLIIEEMSVPSQLRRFLSEVYATANTVHALPERDDSDHVNEYPQEDIYELSDERISRSAVYAVMGDDGAGGRIELVGEQDKTLGSPKDLPANIDGVAKITWPGIGNHPVFQKAETAVNQLARNSNSGGTVIPNPMWKPLPPTLRLISETPNGSVVTVHPLGGCVMGESKTDGVVDQYGRVFDGDKENGVHDGLIVLDGSIVPRALGANPALTIASLALRATRWLCANDWGFVVRDDEQQLFDGFKIDRPRFRPNFSDLDRLPNQEEFEERLQEELGGHKTEDTKIQIVERLLGSAPLDLGDGEVKQYDVELTLIFKDKSLRELSRPSQEYPTGADHALEHGGVVHVRPTSSDAHPSIRSTLRIFKSDTYQKYCNQSVPAHELEEVLDRKAVYIADVIDGTMKVFERLPSDRSQRVVRALIAWFINHGTRDIWQGMAARISGKKAKHEDGIVQPAEQKSLFQKIGAWFLNIANYFNRSIAIASRAGECRAFTYDLELKQRESSVRQLGEKIGNRFVGQKYFTYATRSQPLNQLSTMYISKMPMLAEEISTTARAGDYNAGRLESLPHLELDLGFLARIGIPLIRITEENDGVTGIQDLYAYAAYIARQFIGIHALSFRAPDDWRREPKTNRLPGKLRGIPNWEYKYLYLGDESPHGNPKKEMPVKIRLTRYANPDSKEPPIVMFHGYSASGTTFAHNAVTGNFASHYYRQGRDVWVVDLRSSCGMVDMDGQEGTAKEPWSFEQISYTDIPKAIEYICDKTNFVDAQSNTKKVDVIAHCMGAAMFSMAILRADEAGEEDLARAKLPKCINRAIFIQVGPLVVFSPANIFRGYVARFLRELLPDDYQFTHDEQPGTRDSLIDRLLAILPYPEHEFHLENPLWPCKRTAWTRTRRRMDALYGRVFNLENISPAVLKHIDDFFGPLSIKTVTQTIHFARYNMITDVNGVNSFVSRNRLEQQWDNIPLLMINADTNGLADCSTSEHMQTIFGGDAGRIIECEKIPNAGHQDCLIGGKPRELTLQKIDEFLAKDFKGIGAKSAKPDFSVYPPWIGPIVSQEGDAPRTIRIGCRPTHEQPVGILLFRVQYGGGDIRLPNGNVINVENDIDTLLNKAFFYTTHDFRLSRWQQLPLPTVYPRESGVVAEGKPVNDDGNAWLVMVAYNDSERLYENNDGLFYISEIDQHRGFVRVESDTGRFVDVPPEQPPGGPTFRGPVTRVVRAREAGHFLDFDLVERMVFVMPTREALTNRARQPSPAGVTRSGGGGQGLAPPGRIDELRRREEERENRKMSLKAAVTQIQNSDPRLLSGVVRDEPPFEGESCRFALGSCQYPAGLLDDRIAYRTIRRLNRRILGNDHGGIQPRFVVLAGDQVYADASAGLFDPTIRDGRYKLPYETWLRIPAVRDVLRRIPSYMLLDDHEIDDNWEPITGDPENEKLLNYGLSAYNKYQRSGHELPYDFTADEFRFMMFDTRSKRSGRTAENIASAMISSEKGEAALLEWLESIKSDKKPAFIVTPAMLLPRHKLAKQWDSLLSSLNSDGWDGYPRSLFWLLKQIVDKGIKNLVFLSGDEHIACHAEIRLSAPDSTNEIILHSIHTPATFAPYAFANGHSSEHQLQETIYFSARQEDGSFRVSSTEYAGWQYRCQVHASHPKFAGDGMTYIEVKRDQDDRWQLTWEYPKEQGSSVTIM